MTDGYLSKDRDHLNRMQRERRATLVRIDYMPAPEVREWIEAKRPAYGVEATNSATIDAIVREWASLTGINNSEVERPQTSGGKEARPGINRPLLRAGITPGDSEVFEAMRASDFGTPTRGKSQGKQQRVPCGAKRRRDGQPCQALSVPGKRRCKWHGGASTGPKTPEGKARALANLLTGKSERD